VDHMSGYMYVKHQLGFSSTEETIRAKQNYKQFALGHGVLIVEYLADNGVFKGNKFVQHIREHDQRVQYRGVNAHHQNGGVDYFETYAPVVQWSTVIMLLTMVLSHGWSTKQVDYTNAFAQAEIEEEVFMDRLVDLLQRVTKIKCCISRRACTDCSKLQEYSSRNCRQDS
jgi:hypothetical protein